eukprot:GILJ01021661.1.p1 GENE.GILJ01021661.1~~GILJ01021661.1.p1  ORF type:complete len:1319 (-),score=164.66 GILJ01021661.1:40-3996(-)
MADIENFTTSSACSSPTKRLLFGHVRMQTPESVRQLSPSRSHGPFSPRFTGYGSIPELPAAEPSLAGLTIAYDYSKHPTDFSHLKSEIIGVAASQRRILKEQNDINYKLSTELADKNEKLVATNKTLKDTRQVIEKKGKQADFYKRSYDRLKDVKDEYEQKLIENAHTIKRLEFLLEHGGHKAYVKELKEKLTKCTSELKTIRADHRKAITILDQMDRNFLANRAFISWYATGRARTDAKRLIRTVIAVWVWKRGLLSKITSSWKTFADMRRNGKRSARKCIVSRYHRQLRGFWFSLLATRIDTKQIESLKEDMQDQNELYSELASTNDQLQLENRKLKEKMEELYRQIGILEGEQTQTKVELQRTKLMHRRASQSHEGLVSRYSVQLERGKLQPIFSAWKSIVSKEKLERNSLQTVARVRRLSHSFFQWASRKEKSKQAAKTVLRFTSAFIHKYELRCLNRWRVGLPSRSQMKQRARALSQIFSRRISITFKNFLHNVRDASKREKLVLKMIDRKRRNALVKIIRSWRGTVSKIKQSRRASFTMAHQLIHKQVQEVVHKWSQLAKREQSIRQVLKRNHNRKLYNLQQSVFKQWISTVRVEKELREMRGAVVKKGLKSRKLLVLHRWSGIAKRAKLTKRIVMSLYDRKLRCSVRLWKDRILSTPSYDLLIRSCNSMKRFKVCIRVIRVWNRYAKGRAKLLKSVVGVLSRYVERQSLKRFSTWRHTVFDMKFKLTVMCQFIRKCYQQKLLSTKAGWERVVKISNSRKELQTFKAVGETVDLKNNKMLFAAAVKLWGLKSVGVVFRSWQTVAQRRKRSLKLIGGFVTRWKSYWLIKAINSWNYKINSIQRREKLLSRYLRRIRFHVESKAIRSWFHHSLLIQQQRAVQQKGESDGQLVQRRIDLMTRLTSRKHRTQVLSTIFNGLQTVARNGKRASKLLQKYCKRMQHHAELRALLKWTEQLRVNDRRRRLLLRYCNRLSRRWEAKAVQRWVQFNFMTQARLSLIGFFLSVSANRRLARIFRGWSESTVTVHDRRQNRYQMVVSHLSEKYQNLILHRKILFVWRKRIVRRKYIRTVLDSRRTLKTVSNVNFIRKVIRGWRTSIIGERRFLELSWKIFKRSIVHGLLKGSIEISIKSRKSRAVTRTVTVWKLMHLLKREKMKLSFVNWVNSTLILQKSNENILGKKLNRFDSLWMIWKRMEKKHLSKTLRWWALVTHGSRGDLRAELIQRSFTALQFSGQALKRVCVNRLIGSAFAYWRGEHQKERRDLIHLQNGKLLQEADRLKLNYFTLSESIKGLRELYMNDVYTVYSGSFAYSNMHP